MTVNFHEKHTKMNNPFQIFPQTSSSFLVINTIFIVVVLSLQMNVEYLSVPFLGGIKIEPIGFAFMCVYGLVILTQIIGLDERLIFFK